MKVLVTGAEGYIGRWAVKALAMQDVDIVAVGRHVPKTEDERIETYQMDVLDCSDKQIKAIGKIDAMIHLAWQDGFQHNAASHMRNLPKHIEFIEKAAQAGCKNITVLGTMHEIGYYEGCVDETTPCNPNCFYGISKNALRQSFFILAQQYDFAPKWIRAFYIVGDDQRNHSIFSKIMQWESERKDSFPFNSGRNKYDFIEVDTLGRQIASAAIQTEICGIINACSGHPTALKDQVNDFLQTHGYHIKPAFGMFPDRAYDSPAIWGNNVRIETIMKKGG